jgi:exopolysaccharide biosynthesis polyprenyl glycosylphosphotransferase
VAGRAGARVDGQRGFNKAMNVPTRTHGYGRPGSDAHQAVEATLQPAPLGVDGTMHTAPPSTTASIGIALRERAVPARRPLLRLLDGTGWLAVRLVSDAIMLSLAVVCVRVGAPVAEAATSLWLFSLTFPPLVMLLLGARGLYRREDRVPVLSAATSILSATSLAAISLIALAAFVQPASQHPALLGARAWFYGTVFVIGARTVLALARRRARINGLTGTPTLIVGAGHVGSKIESRLTTLPELGLVPVGFVDPDPVPAADVLERHTPVLGSPAELEEIVEQTGATHVIFAFFGGPDRELLPLVRQCEELGLAVSVVPRLFESTNRRVGLEHIGGLPLFSLRRIDPKGWEFAVKHTFDRVAAALLLLAVSPIMVASALAVRLSSPGPVFFRQRRIGRDGQEFDMLKFRSMRVSDGDPAPSTNGSTPTDVGPGGVEGDDRRTRIGALLRRFSLDELPQLLNVLKGDMSIVGPRPERPEFVELFLEDVYRYDDRHRVKSGITGWAQVHGLRGKTPLLDRVEWDNYYIENWSLGLDFKILLMTVLAIARGAE